MRKTLSQHEIAALQTTAIDQAAGTVNLTTVLAHASGEWIASDWPVCAVADTATPRRMGAALTYARRYALFTLVGIAGEDDLDAPDLDVPNPPDIRLQGPPSSSHGNGRLNGRAKHPEERAGGTAGPKTGSVLLKSMLEASASAALCEQMLAELKTIASADDAATWAHHKLGAKNSLTASDARRVEDAFEAKLASLAQHHPASRDTTSALTRPAAKENARPAPRPSTRAHLRFRSPVAFATKSISGSSPNSRASSAGEARPTRITCDLRRRRALGRKVSDEFTVPLCRGHHREVHRSGDEAAWWQATGIDPTRCARALWLETHPIRSGQDSAAPDRSNATAHARTHRSAATLRRRRLTKRPRAKDNPPTVQLPMVTLKQIEANRRNALRSTGPRSEEGKRRSRCNAVRHGLAAETVIDVLEDAEDYKTFELSVTADFNAETAVERELVLRLASLLWRLRRATAIETGLLEIADNLNEASNVEQPQRSDPDGDAELDA